MSDQGSVLGALAGVVASSAPADHAATGFHHRHLAAPASLPAVAGAFLAAGYGLEMVTCEDRRHDLSKLRLVYTFNRYAPVDRHLVLADLDPGAEAESITAAYPAASWLEREVYDMYGVGFAGHPDLSRILLPDDADFHPLLKDFGRMEDAGKED